MKGDGLLSRDEWEKEIPSWVFDILWPKTAGRRVEKTRYVIPFEEHTLEVDDYHGRLERLVTMECEFGDEGAAAAFVPPSWAQPAIEVTEDKSYKNKILAIQGLSDLDASSGDSGSYGVQGDSHPN